MEGMNFTSYINHVRLLNECREGKADKVKERIKYEGVSVNLKYLYLTTALHVAVIYGKMDVAKVLIDAGANLEILDCRGFTPLEYAKSARFASEIKEHARAVRVSLNNILIHSDEGNAEKLFELFRTHGKAIVCFKDFKNRTALHIACCNISQKHFEIAKFLLSHGADVRALDLHENTPLNDAVRTGNKQVVNLLLEFIEQGNLEPRTSFLCGLF